jgi:SulP family sulfate permease
VPLNVPALALSLGKDDVDINKELIAHGISNTLAGLTGTVSKYVPQSGSPFVVQYRLLTHHATSYLCYVNSVLFARVGGDSRLAGSVLAVVMMGVFAIGPGVIAYLPICVVGALIFVLGIDLLKEALWDTWGKVSWVEYGTSVSAIFFFFFFFEVLC